MSNPKDRIRERREALGLSQLDLALRLGYTDRSTIAKIETGINDLNHKKLDAFAKALNTSLAYLLGLTEDDYDYQRDPDHRREAIPQDIYHRLEEPCEGDLERIWNAYRKGEGRPSKDDLHRELKFALFGGGEDITDEMYEEVVQFAQFVKNREARKKQS